MIDKFTKMLWLDEIFRQKNLVDKAILLSEMWHKDDKRSGGKPYIIHPRAVANKLLEYSYDDDTTQCEAHLHDVVEMAKNTSEAYKRMRKIYSVFGQDIGHGVFVLSDNMGEVSKSYYTPNNSYMKRLLSSRDDIKRVKVADFLHNCTDFKLYPVNGISRKISQAEEFYIPLGLSVAPKMTEELRSIIEEAKIKYVQK